MAMAKVTVTQAFHFTCSSRADPVCVTLFEMERHTQTHPLHIAEFYTHENQTCINLFFKKLRKELVLLLEFKKRTSPLFLESSWFLER